VNISANLLLPTPKGPFVVLPNMSQDIVCVRMFPGMSPKVFQQMIEGPSIKGIVLEGGKIFRVLRLIYF
jgi:L-asparaginase/Glu-tRNA(Gln) amidotransferase subunit D